jgi:hypothetical protein
MKILAYKDLVLAYIRKDYGTDEYEALIKKIFYNENSIFLYSKKFIQFLQQEIDQSELSRESERFAAFVKKIQNQYQDKRPSVKTSGNSENFEDEFLEIHSLQDKFVIGIVLNPPTPKIKESVVNITIIKSVEKPNYHWLAVNLAISHPDPIMVRNYDFNNDCEVDIFFHSIFSIPKNIHVVSVFDDACNFVHNKFNFLINKKIKIYYYTKRLSVTDSKTLFNNLKKKLPSADMFGKKGGGHEREINFENIIIIPTNDFWNLNIKDGQKWSISILYSESEAQKSLNYKDNYKRFLDNRYLDF